MYNVGKIISREPAFTGRGAGDSEIGKTMGPGLPGPDFDNIRGIDMSKAIAIIFAGGSGVRMGSGLPKQFLEINGKPIIIYTLDLFEDHPEIDSIYIACKEDYIPKLEKYISRFQITKVRKIVPGGSSGLDSIYKALSACREENDPEDIVLIHDGVRPFLTARVISDNIRSVKETGSAVTCTPMYETPVECVDGEHVETVFPREIMYTAQAPQSFYLGDILEAQDTVRKDNPEYKGIVDSCSLMKSLGHEPSIIKGNRGNIKVTTPEDLYIMRGLLQYRETERSFGLAEDEVTGRLRHDV